MELQDITTTLGFFWDHAGQARARAELEDLILTLHILRGGTYNENVDWFHERCAQSLLDWRSVGRIVMDELMHPPVVATTTASTAMVWPVRNESRTYSPRRAKRRARKAKKR